MKVTVFKLGNRVLIAHTFIYCICWNQFQKKIVNTKLIRIKMYGFRPFLVKSAS